MPEAFLGISAFYHDSAAALLVDGQIVAAAQEERFTRKKHDPAFPHHAARFVLHEAGIKLSDIRAVAFYDKPYLKFERLLETYVGFAPQGLKSFLSSIPVWIKEKLFMRSLLNDELRKLGIVNPKLLFPEHHLSHAASAFYPSPFKDAAILTVDGVGEWATTTICKGTGNKIQILKELHFPHSLGLLYSAFTAFCGFRVNSGEYKLMGLAPYGNPSAERVEKWKKDIHDQLVDVREDGSLLLNMPYFPYAKGLTMFHKARWEKLFGIQARLPESELTQEYMDLALAIQQVTEEIMFSLANTAYKLTGCTNLVMAGGVALNCVANGKLLKKGTFKNIWIQPAAGDAGGALGAALAALHIWQGARRTLPSKMDAMNGAYLGPEFSQAAVLRTARRHDAPHQIYNDEELYSAICKLLSEGNVVGWFQGRMEFGPRALGNRSILGDPRHPEMQKKLNLKIKYRESFRPFAPSVLVEQMADFFELETPSPYMLLVAPVSHKICHKVKVNNERMSLYDRLCIPRSSIPAVTHVDYSARIQSVSKESNLRYWRLINTFYNKYGCPLLINTSFNVRGEPIVCTPNDAYTCFMRTEMDFLVMENVLFSKNDQPTWTEDAAWMKEFVLD